MILHQARAYCGLSLRRLPTSNAFAGAALVCIALAACGSPSVTKQPIAPGGVAPSAPAQSSPATTPVTEDFAAYWDRFREAAVNDPRSLVKLTRFPFITNGETDEDPERAHDQESFLAIVDVLLADDVGGPAPETHREYFIRNQMPPPNAVTGDQARVGNFIFFRVDGRWLLSRGFLVE